MTYIKFSKNLDVQEIYANGIELATILGQDRDINGNKFINWPDDKKELVHTIQNPVLITDLGKISKLEPILRDTVSALINSQNRIVEYNNTVLGFHAQNYPGVWGPSIDTLFLCQYLNELNAPNTIFEAGCGAGFIGKYLLDHFSEIEQATLTDLNKTAIDCAKACIQDERLEAIVGDANTILNNKKTKYDLIVTNPPYIPRPDTISESPYEGLDMISELIKQSRQSLTKKGKLISIISHLSEPIINKLLEEEKVNFEYVREKLVPFSVRPVLNNKPWLNYLKTHNLIEKTDTEHTYWHKIKILEITKK